MAPSLPSITEGFGEKGDYGHDFGINTLRADGKPGADGAATGDNNSGAAANCKAA